MASQASQVTVSMAAIHFVEQPSFREAPVALYGSGRYAEYGAGFFFAETAEKSELYDSAPTDIQFSQAIERFIECKQLHGSLWREYKSILNADRLPERFAFFRSVRTGVVHQNSAHHGRGCSEKMRPALPVYLLKVC